MPRLTRGDAASQEGRQAWLSEQLVARVTLVWTNNRTSMISARGNATAGYSLRLHRMFHQAPDVVWHALVAYLRGAGANARRTLRTYIQHQQHLIHESSPRQMRPQVLQPQGCHFDLEVIYIELNQTYFANRVYAHITWARRPPKRPRMSIRFGSYHDRDKLIRIHRLLDQPFVPRYVIENIVYHEMLHQLIPRRRVNGRWQIHPPEFRQQEQRFPYHQQAEEWQRRHLLRLLRG